MRKRDKKGQGHVEMILSFIIFVGFLIFLLIFINPVKKDRLNKTLLDITEDAVMEELLISYNLTSLKTETKDPAADKGRGTWGEREVEEGFFTALGDKFVIKNDVGIIIQPSTIGSGFYYLYFSEFFNGEFPEVLYKKLLEFDYEIGAILEKKAVRKQNLIDFKTNYDGDYEELKEVLGIENDFGFSVFGAEEGVLELEIEGVDVEMKGERFMPETNILARNIYVAMMDDDANIEYIIINIEVAV